MKKVILVLILFLAGASFYYSKSNHPQEGKALASGLRKNVPFHEVKPTAEVVKVKAIAQSSTGYEELEEKYQGLSLEELEEELASLEAYSKKANFFARANSGEMDETTTLEVTEYLRKDTVLRHLIMEQKLDELEREYL